MSIDLHADVFQAAPSRYYTAKWRKCLLQEFYNM